MGTSPATPAPATATLLLPASGRCLQPLPRSFAAALARADRLSDGIAGIRAQVLRHFAITPRGWPIAALTREFDAGDADRSAWLRADPAWIRPDINGARMAVAAKAGPDDKRHWTDRHSSVASPALAEMTSSK